MKKCTDPNARTVFKNSHCHVFIVYGDMPPGRAVKGDKEKTIYIPEQSGKGKQGNLFKVKGG